jgi:hypothetical protein
VDPHRIDCAWPRAAAVARTRRSSVHESLPAVDTFFVGVLKGVGNIYLQTAIDCHSHYAWARLYPSKLPITAVHRMNNDVIPPDPAPDRYSFITRDRRYSGPVRTGLQTLRA